MRTELIRSEVRRLLRQVPFRPFLLTLESGQLVVIEHPENIAFDPRPGSSSEFYVLSGSVRLFSTFDAVTSASILVPPSGSTEEQVQA
ncbi:MAG: hypothetical protein HYS12_21610 [Planctomycetes bacterium]|nr:hypothetical protein [Planctomycetota bacterium]